MPRAVLHVTRVDNQHVTIAQSDVRVGPMDVRDVHPEDAVGLSIAFHGES